MSKIKKWNVIILVAEHDNKSEEKVWDYVNELGWTRNKLSGDVVFHILVDSPSNSYLVRWSNNEIKMRKLDKKKFLDCHHYKHRRGETKSDKVKNKQNNKSNNGKGNNSKHKNNSGKDYDGINYNDKDYNDKDYNGKNKNNNHITCSKALLKHFIKISRQSDPAENYAFFYSGDGLGFYLENDYTCPLTVADMRKILESVYDAKDSKNIKDSKNNETRKDSKDEKFYYGKTESSLYNNLEFSSCSKSYRDCAHTWNLIGFDACLMSTLETAVELFTVTPYILACENYEPDQGFLSSDFVEAFKNHTDPVVIGKIIIDSFIRRVNIAGVNSDPADIALLSTAKIFCLVDGLSRLHLNLAWPKFNTCFKSELPLIDSNLENEIFFVDLFSFLQKYFAINYYYPDIISLESKLISYPKFFPALPSKQSKKESSMKKNPMAKNYKIKRPMKKWNGELEKLKNLIINDIVIIYRQSNRMQEISAAKNYHGLSFYAGMMFPCFARDRFERKNYPRLIAPKLIPWLVKL